MKLLATGPLAIVLAALAAIAVAQFAVEVLSPDPVSATVKVTAEQVLDGTRLESAEKYRAGRLTRAIASLLIKFAVLTVLVLARPPFLHGMRGRLDAAPLRGATLIGAAIALVLGLAAIPVGIIGHERAVDVGLSNQSLGAWLGDRGISASIEMLFAAIGALMLVALQRRFARSWWVPGSLVIVVFAIAATWLGPYLLTPLFNDLDRLADGPARDEVVKLAARAGVDVDEVYRIDASQRSRSLNAYVEGLGGSKRVVLYDTVLDRVEGRALRALLAHELAHVSQRDIPRGILFVALVAPFGLLFVRIFGDRLALASGVSPGTPAAIPSFALALALASLVIGVISNQLSRDVEAKADEIASGLTEDPRGLVSLQRELARVNLSDPDPPGWATVIFSTHPPPVDRVAMAKTISRRGSR